MVIQGIVEEIVYRNAENNYTVFVIDHNDEYLTCVGKVPIISEGEMVELVGEFTKHSKYGEQFSITQAKVSNPNTGEGIVRYLSSGLIRGVGPITAQNIVDKFGELSLDIIEFNPAKLAEVKGISHKKAMEIAESVAEIKAMRESVMLMQGHGISTNLAVKIYNHYGERTDFILKSNPYKLVEDIDGIGFFTADKIAQKMGIDEFSEFRIRAGILHILKENSEKGGNTYIHKENLFSEITKLLNILIVEHIDLVNKVINVMVMDSVIKLFELDGIEIVMLYKFYSCEKMVAGMLNALKNAPNSLDMNVDGDIALYEEMNNISMHSTQKDAVKLAVNSGVSVITGGPGTGKTTIVKCILQILKNRRYNVKLLAPTGRASKRLSESTGEEASTIHRALVVDFKNPGMFLYNSGNKLPYDAVIVDEVSMVDIQLMFFLVRALKMGTKLILVGDKDQLPSVGAGNVLADILESGVIPVESLTHIYRQSENSLIVTNAHEINVGNMPVLDNKSEDFFFDNKSDNTDILNSIIHMQTTRIPKYLGVDSSHIQVLAPMKAGICGVENLNKCLQEKINPLDKYKMEIVRDKVIYREKDRVMQITNNYEKSWSKDGEYGQGVFNGDIGIITKIDISTSTTTVLFEDGRVADYLLSELNELVLSYAITIHKSQGSEFDVVIIPAITGAPMLLTKNLLYTAVTRAKKMVVLVGTKRAIRIMVSNNYTEVRYSMLKYFLKNVDIENTLLK